MEKGAGNSPGSPNNLNNELYGYGVISWEFTELFALGHEDL